MWHGSGSPPLSSRSSSHPRPACRMHVHAFCGRTASRLWPTCYRSVRYHTFQHAIACSWAAWDWLGTQASLHMHNTTAFTACACRMCMCMWTYSSAAIHRQVYHGRVKAAAAECRRVAQQAESYHVVRARTDDSAAALRCITCGEASRGCGCIHSCAVERLDSGQPTAGSAPLSKKVCPLHFRSSFSPPRPSAVLTQHRSRMTPCLSSVWCPVPGRATSTFNTAKMRCAIVLAMLMGQAQAQTKKACAGGEPAYVALDSTLKACKIRLRARSLPHRMA
jgi:hypothetical protein